MAEHSQIEIEQSARQAGFQGSVKKQNQRSGFGRWSGMAVFAAVAFPIVAAYIVFYTGVGMPNGTVNQGELLVPAHDVADIRLLDDEGAPITIAAEEPKWRYLIIGEAQCAEVCEKLLYTTRQVHIRLGDKAHRVERILVTGDALGTERHTDLANQHPKLRFATAEQQQIERWLADSDHAALKRPSVLLVDQKGFAMMVYDNRYSGNQLLKDIKRLLKYSYEK